MGFLLVPQPGVVESTLGETGFVNVEVADRLPEGWRDWLAWNEVCDRASGRPGEEAEMLRVDAGRLLGFTRIVARRTR